MRTEHFGTVGVGVGDGGKWVGMGRMETGNDQGLVMLLGEGNEPKNQYLTASPDRVVQIPGSPASVLATIAEQTYSDCFDLQSGNVPPAIQILMSRVPVDEAFRSDARGRQKLMAKMAGFEAGALMSLLIGYGKETGAVEPNYLNGGTMGVNWNV